MWSQRDPVVWGGVKKQPNLLGTWRRESRWPTGVWATSWTGTSTASSAPSLGWRSRPDFSWSQSHQQNNFAATVPISRPILLNETDLSVLWNGTAFRNIPDLNFIGEIGSRSDKRLSRIMKPGSTTLRSRWGPFKKLLTFVTYHLNKNTIH